MEAARRIRRRQTSDVGGIQRCAGWVKDPATGKCRHTSEAFDDARDKSPLSVAIAEEISGTDAFLKGYVGNGIAAFTAGYG